MLDDTERKGPVHCLPDAGEMPSHKSYRFLRFYLNLGSDPFMVVKKDNKAGVFIACPSGIEIILDNPAGLLSTSALCIVPLFWWGERPFQGSGKGILLKINVSKIPEGGMVLRFERDGEWFRENLPGSTPCDFVPDRIDIDCTARRTRENVFVEGTVATAVDMSCCRCLEMIHLPIRSSFKYTFTSPPPRSQDEVELNAADLDFAYYEGDVIDLDTVIFEQIILQIPIKPLCAELCRGLCSHCGINLNTASCDCRSEVLDERLVALKQFKTQH
jgi:uncharacterized protein